MLLCPRVRIHPAGPEFSRIIAGMWRMDTWPMLPTQRLAFIQRCLDLGVTSFDHADIYGNYGVESLFAEALALQPGLREKIELVSKFGIRLISPARPEHRLKTYDTRAEHMIASVEQSLCNLNTDRLDLLLIHRPDPLMRFDDVAEAFSRLHAQGKVLHFGVSNFSARLYDLLNRCVPLVTNQVECSPLHLGPIDDGVFDQLQFAKTAPMIWSPLGGGRLLSDASSDPAVQRIRKTLIPIAAQYNCSMATIIYAWLMKLPCNPLPLTGSGRIEAIDEAVQATQIFLSHEQWFAILEAARGAEVP